MRIPKHIGVIPDGNRRWATQQGMEKQQGYHHGLAPGLALLQKARALGVEEISYYGFTIENCKRPKAQFLAFQSACVEAFDKIAQEPVSIRVVGDSHSACFPKQLLPYIQRQELNGGGLRVNFLVNYSWQWDLQDTALEKGQYHSMDIPRIELVIRWGGMRRLSGFLPIQTVYADFYVVEELWPDFQPQHVEQALDWYQKQDVTMGG